jgi:VanZ family protein
MFTLIQEKRQHTDHDALYKRLPLFCIAYAAGLALVSLLPSEGRISGWDSHIDPELQNLLHVPAYAILYWLCWRAKVRPMGGGGLVMGGICIGYGGLLELLQVWIPGRWGSTVDVLLNAAGVTVAFVTLSCFSREVDKHE